MSFALVYSTPVALYAAPSVDVVNISTSMVSDRQTQKSGGSTHHFPAEPALKGTDPFILLDWMTGSMNCLAFSSTGNCWASGDGCSLQNVHIPKAGLVGNFALL